MTVSSILKVNNIYKSFDAVKAVDDVSFEVFPGEILGLLGPNGAGKTTVIRMIMGIFAPDAGEIELYSDLAIDKTKIGYLPEERGIYDDTKVLDTILYFADLKGVDRREAKERALGWLEELELAAYAKSKVDALSKGMQQKLQFIISIVHKPKLLVLDELFSGLDPVNQDFFKKIVRQLAAEGTTVLFSSHQMNLVEELCDRIFMIDRGRQVLYGEINRLKDDFGEKNVRITLKNGQVDFFKQYALVKGLEINGRSLAFRLPARIMPDEFLRSLPEDLGIEEISLSKPSLHDIFVTMVKRGVS